MKGIKKYLDTRQQLFDDAGIQPEAITVSTTGPVKRVHYLRLGSGIPLILIHGGGSNSTEWINILKPLSEKYHLYVVDRPGSGLTDFFDYRNVDIIQHSKDFINSFMDAVHLKEATFLAQSMGAFFLLNFAQSHPERISSLICIGAPAGINNYIPVPLRCMGTPFLNRILVNTFFRPTTGNIRKLYENLFVADVSQIPEVYFEHCSYHQQLPGWADSFFSLLENVLTIQGWKGKYYLGNKLHRLKIPVNFIWGEKDAFERPETGFTKVSVISQYRFEVVKDAGHCPWIDKPRECIQLIEEMLKPQVQQINHSVKEPMGT